MATDHNSSGRRPHYHRGRRGTDRRGQERRSQQPPPEQNNRPSGEPDVEQIMREIRSRIAQRSGIELSTQQIQDLASRRLEAILDPRSINPTLLDQLRKGATAPPDPLPRGADTEYSLTDDAIYEGGGAVRFFRRLFNPLLKLLFNPAPLITALQTQSRINRDAASRAAELERRQTEWNALHYQILQRLVTEVSRTSIETQALGARLEALAARIDFNDKRVRTLENTPASTRAPRPQEPAPVAAAAVAEPAAPAASSEGAAPAGPAATGDAPRRRRRRRRGRRGAPTAGDSAIAAVTASVMAGASELADVDEEDDEEETVDVAEPSDAASVAAAPVEQVPPEPPTYESIESSPPVAWSPEPEPEVQRAPEPASEQAVEQPATAPIESRDPGTPEN